jgi:hypothetical protein
MRTLVLNLLLFFAAVHALAQTVDASQQLIKKKCGVMHIPLLPGKNSRNYPVLFDSIRVLDFRRDTSRIGLISSGRNTQDEVLFHTAAGDQLGRYLDDGYSSPQGSQSLLVVVKDLWIADPNESTYIGHSLWNIYFRFEAYLKEKDGYIPLTYLDTTVHRIRGYSLQTVAAHELAELIDVFMDKVAAGDRTGDWAEKRRVSYNQIDSFSRTRFDYAMDTVTRPVKGVYANLEEFKNNAPSILQYDVSKDKSGNVELRIPDESGHLYYTHTVWGFCDGGQAYVMMDGNLFPVFCVHHQFYVLGSKEYRDKKLWVPFIIPIGPLALVYGATDVSDNVVRTLRLFRLNVKTGLVTE